MYHIYFWKNFFFSCEIRTEELTLVSLLYFLLTVPDKVPYNEAQEQFSLMSLLIDKTSWLKSTKRLFRKMLWKDSVDLLMLKLGIVQESPALFCHVCMQQGRV